MPKDPPSISLRIDTQEQRSGIPELLAAMPQVQISVTQLQMGDYDVGGDPRRVVERKTASDFLISIADGRLFGQLTALLNSDFAPILLLEGDPLVKLIFPCNEMFMSRLLKLRGERPCYTYVVLAPQRFLSSQIPVQQTLDLLQDSELGFKGVELPHLYQVMVAL